MKAFAAILPVSLMRSPIEFGLIVGDDEPLIEHQARDDANRESAAAETEAEDLVILGADVAAGKFVDLDDVALEAETKCAAENGERLERRGADAVIVERHLIGA